MYNTKTRRAPFPRRRIPDETLTPRGWPVITTGPGRLRTPSYCRQRALWHLPDESPDFSFNDAFDIIGWALRQEQLKRMRKPKKRARVAKSVIDAGGQA